MKAVLSSNVRTKNSFVKTEHNKWDQLSCAKTDNKHSQVELFKASYSMFG